MTDYTASERAARLAEKRRIEGWGQFKVWTPPGTPIDQLRERFPGPAGGIDWPAVIKAALSEQDQGEQ